MGTPGVTWNITKRSLETALKKHKGVVSHVGKEYNIYPHCVQRHVKKHGLQELLNDLRNSYETVLLDDSENCLHNAVLQQDEDMPCALKASFFILNNKGVERGYSHVKNLDNKSEMYLVRVDPTQREDDPVPA